MSGDARSTCRLAAVTSSRWGGEWIGPGQNAVAALIRELGIGAYDHFYEGDTTYDIEGKVSRGFLPDVELSEAADFLKVAWQLDRMCKKLPLGEPWRAKDAATLDRKTFGTWLSERASTSFTPSVFRLITRAVWSGYPERMSLLWILHYLRSAGGLLPVILNDGGAQDQRIEGGSQVISQRMAEALGDRVLLNRPVLRIEDQPPHPVRVITPTETFSANRVVVAMAPADTMRIEFSPQLPKPRLDLASGWARLPRLPVVKAAMLYDEPFWRERRSQRRDAERPELDSTGLRQLSRRSFHGCPQLFPFRRGVPAPRRPSRARRGSPGGARRYFGPKALDATGYVEKDWSTDPWSAGCITPLTRPPHRGGRAPPKALGPHPLGRDGKRQGLVRLHGWGRLRGCTRGERDHRLAPIALRIHRRVSTGSITASISKCSAMLMALPRS